ncbi:MAG TPA: AAA family ATPase, partial [Candidatus Monoglobus merdigallinarum]|nr:AAA family ATPase [Candidatus Monoglobus merdigallinarum]
MILKSVEMQGFKSFADKIYLDFNSGITAIVGPNGSGKSNISDAIRWVMGEQSIKSLRGSKMEDVIFAGTESRKALGFAEVTLHLNNQDNIFDIEFPEVSVTRRLYRSGESEYYINKTLCRLKDVHELFMDTGLGRDGYSMVGQGQIDSILSTKSEDRRQIFEEASGISKYKYRKIEAERKLSHTNDNICRVNDILSELTKQLEPLKRQSEKAKKFLVLRDEMKELEINVSVVNIDNKRAALTKLKEDIDIYSSQIKNLENELSEIDQRISDMFK